MQKTIVDILYIIIVTIVFFLVRKYIFFEPDLDAKKQRIFYVVVFLAALIVQLAFGDRYVPTAVSLIVGINIFLVRKEHKLMGVLVALIPLAGIVNGLLTPLTLLPTAFYNMSEQAALIFQYVFCGALFFLFAIFYVKGKSWRSWFSENMQDRSLSRTEQWLLWVVGIMMLLYANVINVLLSNGWIIENYNSLYDPFLLRSSFEVFFMTAVSIILILVGNRKSFYQEKVMGMQSGMITLMADIVENRDDNTGGHIKRTARYVECIAKELKRRGVYQDILSDEYMKDLVVAAPLHDIGKIHVPDVVLNKPGRLTDEEFAIMKAHTTAGHDLLLHAKEELGEYGYLTMAVEMAAYHHEWWNGSGYPYGISGNDIPLCARIMAVADVFDALISKRIYKDAMPLEKAYAIIREESGTHFEPEIVDAFFAVADDMVLDG